MCTTDRDKSTLEDGKCPHCDTYVLQDTTQDGTEQANLPPEASDLPPDATQAVKDAYGLPYERPLPQIDPSLVKEMSNRQACRRHLLPFIKRFRPKYLAGWVHEDICRRLERFFKAVENKESPRMIIEVPVRHGKSEIGSRHFAPWVLGHHPEWEIIAASGGQSLALTFSRYVRDVMRDPAYKVLFPQAQLESTSQSVENWNTSMGGGYMAAGLGTMIVGRGAHILLVDDPCISAEAADSAVQRDAAGEWFTANALNRLSPGGGVLFIMTHWLEDDLAGRMESLSNSDAEYADKYEVVRYPAINDIGDEYILPDDSIQQFPPLSTSPPEGSRLTRKHNTALHPDRYTLPMLMNTRATYFAQGQQRWWHALYQQDPSPAEGAYFTKAMLRFYETLPPAPNRCTYQAWDFAITLNTASDYTAGATICQDTEDNLYVADVVRFKSSDSFAIADAMLDYWELHGSCATLGVEDGQIWRALEYTFKKRCDERRLYPSYEVLKPLTDKITRSQPLRGRMQSGKMYYDKRAAWWPAVEHELLHFPTGTHDDMVDALAWTTRLVLQHAAPRSAIRTASLKSWRDCLTTLGVGEVGHMAA